MHVACGSHPSLVLMLAAEGMLHNDRQMIASHGIQTMQTDQNASLVHKKSLKLLPGDALCKQGTQEVSLTVRGQGAKLSNQ